MKRRKDNGTIPWVYQYRIVVKKNQQKLLEEVFSVSSRIYTELFRFVDETKKEKGKVTLSDVGKFFARRRREEKDYTLVPAHTGYYLVIRAYNAYERCRKEGKTLKVPKDGKEREVLSVPYRYQGRTKIFQNEKGNWFVHIPNVGNLKLKFHRPLPKGATIKHLEIIKKADGYYLSIYMDVPEESLKRELPPTGRAVGIDLGVQNLITLSTGEQIPHPKWLQKTLEKISLKQSILSKKQKGSRRYRKLKNNIQKLHLKVARQRKDFYYCLSKWLVEHHDYICVEDLNSQKMIQKSSEVGWKGLTKGIMDASWGMFINQILPTKTRLTGRTLIYVDPQYTSQLCSNCLNLVPKSLDERVHRCPYCGIEMDRDVNAARSILILGLRRAFGDTVPFGAVSCPRSSRGSSRERTSCPYHPPEDGRPFGFVLENGRDLQQLPEDGRPTVRSAPRMDDHSRERTTHSRVFPENGRDLSNSSSPRTDETSQTPCPRERTTGRTDEVKSSLVVTDVGTKNCCRQTENEAKRVTDLPSSGDRTLSRGLPFGGNERGNEKGNQGNGREVGETLTEGYSPPRPVFVVGYLDGTETKFLDFEGGK